MGGAEPHLTPYLSRDAEVRPGDTLFGQWQLMRRLGQDGFGAIFEARELKLDEMQEVRVLSEALVAGQQGLLERVRQEVKLMRRLAHPHIGRVYDYREDLDQNLVLISMERIEGGNLRKLLSVASQHQQSVPLPLALSILVQMMEALAEAHRQQINHEDLRPEYVLLTGGPLEELLANPTMDPEVKMVDFGHLSAFLENREEVMRGEVLSIAAYMAPELAKSGVEGSAAADMYGAGVVAYELLTGKLPLGRFSLPSELRTGLPQDLDDLILSLLELDPARRASAASVLPICRRLLAEVEQSEHVAAVGTELARVETKDLITFGQEDEALRVPRSSPTMAPAAKSSQHWWIGGLGVAVLVALGGMFLWKYFGLPETVDETVLEETTSLEEAPSLPVQSPEPLEEPGKEPEPEWTTLKIDLNPADGKLYLGDTLLGGSPQIVELAPGKYYVEGRKDGCENEIVRVDAGQQDEIAIELDCPEVATRAPEPEPVSRAETAIRPTVPILSSGAVGPEAPRGMKFRYVEGGEVWLTVSQNRGVEDQDSKNVEPFWIGETEVTQAQWLAVMGTNPSQSAGCASCPVENVSWLEALHFTNKLSLDSGLYGCYAIEQCTGEGSEETCRISLIFSSCNGYRLPTEAEWELVARAGVEGPLAWTAGNDGCSSPGPRPVGLDENHRWNVRGLSDNVSEWVWTTGGRKKRARGGSWQSGKEDCHPGVISFASQGERDPRRGFRVVRSHLE